MSQLWGQRTVETDSGFSKFKERFFRNFPANNVATGSFGFVLVYGFVWVRQWRHFIRPTFVSLPAKVAGLVPPLVDDARFSTVDDASPNR